MRGREAPGERARHIPVLLAEALEALSPRDGHAYIDGTFGAGGHTRAILESADCRVLAIDRDPAAVAAGQALVMEFAPRLTLAQGCFGDLDQIARAHGFAAVDGVFLDIGVSSMQIDEAKRGFSFQADGPLDMRMSAEGPTAADIVNTFDETRLADILYRLGEERRSRAIVRAIAAARREKTFSRTSELADLVARVLGRKWSDRQHPATRTFQALRIFVNDELGELARGLSAAERCLAEGGRLAVITFHSLEDRIVKRFLSARAGRDPRGSRHLPEEPAPPRPESFQIVNHRPLTSSQDEIAANPRARSARLRAAIRTGNPAWPSDPKDGEAADLYRVHYAFHFARRRELGRRQHSPALRDQLRHPALGGSRSRRRTRACAPARANRRASRRAGVPRAAGPHRAIGALSGSAPGRTRAIRRRGR